MRNFFKILLGFTVLVLIAGFVLLSRINTDRNKQAISAAVLESTGYQLTIGGNLSLDLFPIFGFSLSDVRLKNPAYPQELGSASQVVLRVELAPLLNRSLKVQEIIADNFHINYFIDSDGRALWSVNDSSSPSASTNVDSTSPSTDAADSNVELSIDQLQIRNASIDFQDSFRGTRYRLDQMNLLSRNSNLNGQPFDVEISFNYENNGMSAPVPINLQSEIDVDIATGDLALRHFRASINPMMVTGAITLASLNTTPTYSAQLSADAFDVIALLQSLGVVEMELGPEPGITADRDLAFDLDFSGNSEQASLNSLLINFASTQIEADANVRMATEFAPMNVSYNLSAGAIDLSPFFPEEEATEVDQESADETLTQANSRINSAAQYQPETELPVDLISDITVLGSASIESILINDIRFDDINLFINVEDRVLDIEMPPLSAFEGSIQATARLNVQQSSPTFEATANASALNLVDLAPSLSRFSTVSGFLSTESTYTAHGRTTSDIMNTLSGNTAFTLTESSVDIGVIKQIFTAIAALSPTGEAIQQWPDVIRFNEMSGYHLLDNGFKASQEIKLRMDNFDISGNGGFDLDVGTFDYDMAFTVLGEPYTQTIPINELYHDVSWPVDCNAPFSESANRYCRPDFTRVREIFAQIGTNAVRSQLEDVITDQLPARLQDSARDLLRNIFN